MHSRLGLTSLVVAAAFIFAVCPHSSIAQLDAFCAIDSVPSAATTPCAIPDAPTPQINVASFADSGSDEVQGVQMNVNSLQASGAPETQGTQRPASAPNSSASGTSSTKSGTAQNTSSSQDSTEQSNGNQTKAEKQRQEVTEQEHQRVLGVAPNFNLTYRHNAVPLTAMQKIDVAFHSSVDPFTFGAAFLVAGYHEALDEDTGFGWGAEGYFKRTGAAYLDTADGDMIGNGFLPALLHQDPRYFRLGQGTIKHRILYSVATNFICKGDNGHWQPNISNVGGNIIAGALSNLYYPSQNSGWGQTIGNGMIVTTEGAFGSLFDEFWPDISRKVLHKDPTHGLDAQQVADQNGSGSVHNNKDVGPGDSGPGSGNGPTFR